MPALKVTQCGTLFRVIRERAGLRQDELASYLSVKKSSVKSLEAGKSKLLADPAFYQGLRNVPGFTDTDITNLLLATEYAPIWFAAIKQHEEAKRTRPLTIKESRGISGAPILRIPTVEGETYGIIREQTTSPRMGSGEQLTKHTSDTEQQVDPSAAQGTKPPEHGLEPTSRRETAPKPARREKAERKRRGVVYEKTRSHYDREYIQENAENVVGLVVEAAQINDPALSQAAEQTLQSMHVIAEAVAKRKGSSLSKVSRDRNIPLNTLSRWVIDGLVQPLYRDKKTIYIANETAEELDHIKQEAIETGEKPGSLLRARRNKYIPQETSPGEIYNRGNISEIRIQTQGATQSYEVVTSLQEAAEKSGVPIEELMTIPDIEAEWNINRGRLHGWTRRGIEGQPHLPPLPVRLSGRMGSSKLLFLRRDVEWSIANPPKGGRPPK
jgi:transcriptional regulator with XRE-family HTH domain